MADHSFLSKSLKTIGIEYKGQPRPNFLSKIVLGIIRKYDVNWFLRFLKMEAEEDGAAGKAVHDSFKQVAWVNIAVTKRNKNIARAPFTLYNGDTPVETGPVYKLFRDVNPYMSKGQLFDATGSWLDTRGEAFWLFEPDLIGVPTQIWIPDPANMKARLGKDKRISMWTYEIGNEKIPYLPDQLIHFRDWNPWNAYRGINPLIALETDLSSDFLAGISNLNLIRNGSIPQGVMSTDQRLSVEDAKAHQQRWMDEHKGSGKVHKISVLGQGVSYQKIQASPADMEYFAMKKWTRETILSRYNIPVVLAGITDTPATLSGDDTKDQLATFWTQSLIPRLKFFEEKLETDFFARYKVPFTGKFDLSDIPELQEDEDKKREVEGKDVLQGILTINEVRDRRGLPPVSWGDVAWLPLNLVPAGQTFEPTQIEAAITETPIKFLEPTATPIAIFEKAKPAYTPLMKEMHWKAVVKTWERIEVGYSKALQEWLYGQRVFILDNITREKAVEAGLIDDIMDVTYWATQEAELKAMSKVWFMQAVAASEEHIFSLLELMGIEVPKGHTGNQGKVDVFEDIEIVWTIFDTRAVAMLDVRVSKLSGVMDTIKKAVNEDIKFAIREGLSETDAAELLTNKYNGFKSHTKTIARTEIGGVLGDSRIASYEDFGWTKHEWLTALDADVRPSHQIDGEIAVMGENFSNGMRWPYDETADAGNIINCRCLSVPVVEE